MNPVRGIALVSVASALLLAPSFAVAAAAGSDYPARPVRLVVPFAPGGTVDIVARLLGARIAETTGQQVVLDNRGGGGGVIGTGIVTQARGDGYTLLIHSAAIAYEPALRTELPYVALRDLAPVTPTGTTANLLVTHPAFAAKTARDLIALAKEKPGAVSYGTGGVGSSSHLAVELFMHLGGVRFNHVPYKGAGPALIDVVGGQVNFMIATMPGAIAHVRGGRLRALGVSGPTRSPAAPDVPTIAESGLPGYEFIAWFGLFAPAATPPKLIERIATLAREAQAAPEIRAKLDAQGIEPRTLTPAEFRAYVRKEITLWATVIRQAGIQAN